MGLRYKVQALNWFLYQHVNPRLNSPANHQKSIHLGEYQKICQGQFYGGVLGEEGKTGNRFDH